LEWKYDLEFFTLLGFSLCRFLEDADTDEDAADDLGSGCGKSMGVEVWFVVDISAPIVGMRH